MASLLCDDAVVTGPLAPAGRAEGAEATKRFLEAQNTDPSGLPAHQREHHEIMASSRARLKRVIEETGSIAVEAELVSGLDGKARGAALFIDVDPQCGIKSVTIYFNALPD